MFQRNVWASIMALCVCSLALCSSQASAQENTVLKQYYGNGVHAFYSGNYVEAFDLLSKPIDAKIEDPRPYYFRGFTLMELGRPEQAEKDFKAGAELELKDTTGRFPVNFALERCQGKSRIALEKARNEVQLAAFQRRAKYNNAIYNNRIEDQKATLIPDNIDLSGGSTLDIDDGDALINDTDSGNPLLDEDEENAKPVDDGDNADKSNDSLFDDVDSLDNDDAIKPADDGDDAEKANDNLFDDDSASPADNDNTADDSVDPFGANDDDNTSPTADDNVANDNILGNDADDDTADKPAENGIFGNEEDDNKADDADAAANKADDANAADDNAEPDPFTEETPEETADANPFKDANLDEDDADAANKADDADNANAADKADDADNANAADKANDADKADDATDKADDNADQEDPFSDFEF